ncbi:hypothetical protein PMIN04_007946 [Paraphaeosphaeria minitans]
MANRYPRSVSVRPVGSGSGSSPLSINNINLPGAWPPEPADSTGSASTPSLAAHSARRPVLPTNRRRPGVSIVENPIITHSRSRHAEASDLNGTQQSNFSSVEANAVRSTSNGRSNSRAHPYLPSSQHTMGNERVKTEEALQKTTSHIPQPLLEAHAPLKKDRHAKDGHWTKKDVKQFQMKLEDLYQKQHEEEKQDANHPQVDGGHRSTSISVGMEASTAASNTNGTNVNGFANGSAYTPGLMVDASTCTQTQACTESDQQAHDLIARQRRNHEQRRLFARMEAANRLHANKKVTAELQHITKGVQNMRISHVGGEVPAAPVRPEVRPSPSVHANQQPPERVNATFAAPKPTDNTPLFATKRSLFVSDTETIGGNRPEGTTSHKPTENFSYGQPPRDTSTSRDATTIRTIKEVDQARKMQELREKFLTGMTLAPDVPVSVQPNAQDTQNDKAAPASFKDMDVEPTRTMSSESHLHACHPNGSPPRDTKSKPRPYKRVHFHPTVVRSVPKPLCLDPVPAAAAAAADDVNMDLYDPPSPRAAPRPAGVFTEIPLSSPPHQGSLENDFVEVDVEELDGLDWEVINA